MNPVRYAGRFIGQMSQEAGFAVGLLFRTIASVGYLPRRMR